MPLNLKTYQGYDRQPFCKAHYPKPNKFTFIPDTPELKRALANTQVISNVGFVHYKNDDSQAAYSKDWKHLRGHYIYTTDDLESQRHKFNSWAYSGFAYANQDYIREKNKESTSKSMDNVSCTNPQKKTSVYRAIYPYTALEDDEVTFVKDDIILEGDPIDAGWMYGRVQRTGKWGMLPSNYVEKIQ
ncbi:LIM and SH3 domain protein 1 [Cichlidogyrus casuarinus]|uniref:LIM and SH3 domain protein 1 n=1 Tax=Cichlidogyrus casuarinus TaxID=1844966 RepID=A0ABD2QPX1_9PLAT